MKKNRKLYPKKTRRKESKRGTRYMNLEKELEVADQAISEGSSNLQAHINAKCIDTKNLQADNHMIQMGIQRKCKLSQEIFELIKKKKAKIMSSK